ncbi:MAG: tyrosine-type recombinase/integrase [Saprospiraceae bacterium]|nr:tyrosine-type recombinase/integrase [Saprospiraceae bacterium]
MSLDIIEVSKPNSLNLASLTYRKSINGKIFKIGLKYLIFPELWDHKTRRPTIDTKLIKEYSAQDPKIPILLKNVRYRIDNIAHAVEKYIEYCKTQGISPDFLELTDVLNKTVLQSDIAIKRPTTSENSLSQDYILNYARSFVQQIEKGQKLIATGKNIHKRYSIGTIKTFKNFIVTWHSFEVKTGHNIKWNDLDKSIYKELVDHLLNESNYTINSCGKVIKTLKVICQAALDDKIHVNIEFRKPYFLTLSEDIDNVYLTTEETELLEKWQITNDETKQRAKDIFLLGCYTALRFSDLKRITSDHLKKGQNKRYTLTMITQKTKEKVIIPLKPKGLEILKKYDYQSPKIEEQTVNRLIKSICKDAGIGDIIERKSVINGETKIKKYPKYSLITTHTARRTAATQMFLSGIPSLEIMKITGHKSESNFLKYICVTKQQTATKLAENQFFK